MSVTPSTRSEAMTVAASTSEKSASTQPTGTPLVPATSASKTVKRIAFHQTKSTAAVSARTPAMTNRSASLMPKISPKRAASKSREKRPWRLIRATPRAKAEVVTMPTAASPPICRRRAAPLMSSTESAPHTVAPA